MALHGYVTVQAHTRGQQDAVGAGAAGILGGHYHRSAYVAATAIEEVAVVESVEFKFHESAGSKISNLNHSLKPDLT